MLPELERDTFGTVIAITGKSCRVQLAGGDVINGLAIEGASVGQSVRLRYSGGTYSVQGGAGGGASGSSAVMGGSGAFSGAPSPHDLLGAHHTLPTLSANLFLASPISASGLPAFRAIGPADLPGQFSGFGNPTALAGMTAINGTATTAMRSDAAPAINPAILPNWSGVHTFNAGQRVAGAMATEYGAGIAGKQADAGKIGYQTFTAGALDIVGAGTTAGQRIVKLWDNTHIVGYVGSEAYTSQSSGWRINSAGAADFRYVFVDEMHAKSFIADLEQALAGGQIISKSVAMLGKPFTAPAAGGSATLWPRDLPSAPDMAVFQSGDIVRVRTFLRSGGSLSISDCWGVVTSYADGTGADAGLQSWTFTRSVALNAGAMAAGTVVPVDSIVLDYGTSGNGIWETNAIDGVYGANSPYTQAVQWTGHPATGSVVRYRAGKLDGWGAGYSGTNTFGFAAGNAAGTWVAAEATNGFRVMYGSVAKGQWDTGGNLTIGEVGTGKSNVHITNAGTLFVRNNTANVVRLSPSSESVGFYTYGTVADFTGNIYVSGTTVMESAVLQNSMLLAKAGRINSTGAAIPIAFETGQPHLAFEHWTLAGAAGLGRIYADSYQPNVGTIDFNSALVIETFAVNHYRWSDGAYVGQKGTQIILRAPAGANGGGGVSVEGTLAVSGVSIQGTAGRNYFRDNETVTAGGQGLRVGAVWNRWGIYADAGDLCLAAASNTIAAYSNIDLTPQSRTIYSNNWFRSVGDSGWYSETYGGGWYMIDTTWLRAYNNKAIYTPNIIRGDGGFNRNGVAGGIYVPLTGYVWLVDTTGFALNAGLGRAVGNYVITLNANGNNIPVGAKAIAVRLGAKWTSTSENNRLDIGDGSTNHATIRANTLYWSEITAIINININHQIGYSIAGAGTDRIYANVVGYFY
jgi:hypothetical protein